MPLWGASEQGSTFKASWTALVTFLGFSFTFPAE